MLLLIAAFLDFLLCKMLLLAEKLNVIQWGIAYETRTASLSCGGRLCFRCYCLTVWLIGWLEVRANKVIDRRCLIQNSPSAKGDELRELDCADMNCWLKAAQTDVYEYSSFKTPRGIIEMVWTVLLVVLIRLLLCRNRRTSYAAHNRLRLEWTLFELPRYLNSHAIWLPLRYLSSMRFVRWSSRRSFTAQTGRYGICC
jgi:hypothetical protein